MANISRNTFSESKGYDKVILQQGVPITDYDFNEAQDIQRVKLRRMIEELFGDGAIGEGFRVQPTSTPSRSVVVTSGTLYVSGYRVSLGANTTIELPTAPSTGTRKDYVYAEVMEQEIDSFMDPDIKHPKLTIEPTRRIKISVNIKVSSTGIPNDTSSTKYYGLAEIERRAGENTILAADILDKRHIKVELDLHTNDTNNPHKVTAEQVGAMPKGPITWNQLEGKY